ARTRRKLIEPFVICRSFLCTNNRFRTCFSSTFSNQRFTTSCSAHFQTVRRTQVLPAIRSIGAISSTRNCWTENLHGRAYSIFFRAKTLLIGRATSSRHGGLD